jgi:hypothetical protein
MERENATARWVLLWLVGIVVGVALFIASGCEVKVTIQTNPDEPEVMEGPDMSEIIRVSDEGFVLYEGPRSGCNPYWMEGALVEVIDE